MNDRNEPDPDAGRLGTLLHERVHDLHPDLAERATSAIRAGTRLQRRRQLTAAAAGLGGLAAAALIGAQLLPGGSVVAGEGDFAADPTSSPTPPAAGPVCVSGTGQSRGDQLNAWLDAQGFASLPEALEALSDEQLAGCTAKPEPQDLPVSFEAPGWTCDEPADDKFTCTKGAASVLVVVRPAARHDDYLHDPDKAVPGSYVSGVHGGFFATLEVYGGQGAADALADHLVWD